MDVIEMANPWHLAITVIAIITLLTLLGMHRSSRTNFVIVSITLASLALYSLTLFGEIQWNRFFPIQTHGVDQAYFPSFFEATALMFVAYTGYGRVATLGEEIHDPVKNIPKAVILTLAVSFILYLLVAVVSIGSVGADFFYAATQKEAAPLEVIAASLGHPTIAKILAVGAMTAMLGVLLNLILGVSRVIYAMGVRKDLPGIFTRIDDKYRVPYVAILVTGAVIFLLALTNNIKTTWSFSAFTVLFYYAFTNLSALRLPKEKRLYPRVFAWLGLFGCLSLAFWVDQIAIVTGFTILGFGVVWRVIYLAHRKKLRLKV